MKGENELGLELETAVCKHIKTGALCHAIRAPALGACQNLIINLFQYQKEEEQKEQSGY